MRGLLALLASAGQCSPWGEAARTQWWAHARTRQDETRRDERRRDEANDTGAPYCRQGLAHRASSWAEGREHAASSSKRLAQQLQLFALYYAAVRGHPVSSVGCTLRPQRRPALTNGRRFRPRLSRSPSP